MEEKEWLSRKAGWNFSLSLMVLGLVGHSSVFASFLSCNYVLVQAHFELQFLILGICNAFQKRIPSFFFFFQDHGR